MITLFNNTNIGKYITTKFPDIKLILPYELSFEKRLYDYLKENRTEPMIIDAELNKYGNSKLQNLEGLKFAYLIRTEPIIKYLGEIFVVGFTAEYMLSKNSYSDILNNLNKVYYVRYPTVFDINITSPLCEEDWGKCVDLLDYNFISEFRKFEHSFRNYRILPEDDLSDKLEELSSHHKTLILIGMENHISSRFCEDYQNVKYKFDNLIALFINNDKNLLNADLMNLKLLISNFKSKYADKYK